MPEPYGKNSRPGIPQIRLRLPGYLTDTAVPCGFSPEQRAHLCRIADALTAYGKNVLPGRMPGNMPGRLPNISSDMVPGILPGRTRNPVLSLRASLSEPESSRRGSFRTLTAEAALSLCGKPLLQLTVRERWTEDGAFCTEPPVCTKT